MAIYTIEAIDNTGTVVDSTSVNITTGGVVGNISTLFPGLTGGDYTFKMITPKISDYIHNGVAPTSTSAPSFSGTVAAGNTITIIEGTYTGTPAPTISGILTLNGIDVSADMVGLDYTIPTGTGGQALAWSETASNDVAPDATQSVSDTVVAI